MTRVCGEKLFKSPCPPVMLMPGPPATIRGTNDQPFVNRIAQIHREEGMGTDIPDRGETRLQSLARMNHRSEGMVEGRVRESVKLIITVGAHPQVRMAIDQPGQDRGFREINDLAPRWNLGARRRPHFLNPTVANSDEDFFAQLVGRRVKHPAGEEINYGRTGLPAHRSFSRVLGPNLAPETQYQKDSGNEE